MRVFAFIALVAMGGGAAFSQTAAPAFEIADVHVSAPARNPNVQGGLLHTGIYELRQATMLDLIKTAYGIDGDTVFGGPSCLDWDRFDVAAKTPPSTSAETARLMLRALLADRFNLVIHKDTRALPGFVLTVGRGKPKLKEAEGSGGAGCQAQPPPPPNPGVAPYIVASCRNMTMEEFAATLHELASEYLDGPVVDSTGLEGTWDFDFKWTPRGPLQSAGADGLSLFDAMERQLGLKLQPQKLPMPVIVVDNVNRKPAENPRGVENILPPPPPEFEVASIRPSLPDTPPPPPAQFQPGGRLNWRGFPLRAIVVQAWDLDPDPHAKLIGAPKWLDSARFDLVAKAPATTTIDGAQIWSDDLEMMLRALLVDRFKMAVHYEERLVDVYTLVAVKPKLKPADTLNRTGCKTGPSQAPRDPGEGPPPFVATCRNIGMAQFAERLQDIARSYIRYPVLDATGIEGAWDFTLTYNPAPPPDGRRGPDQKTGGPTPPAGMGGLASDPIGGISLFAAVERQLGLKLEAHKRIEPVLIIDHIEEKPTDN
jgi:uncharacterized protein (TIGR03435 family)